MDKFEAEGDAPTTVKKKRWLLEFANKEFGKRPNKIAFRTADQGWTRADDCGIVVI